MDTFCTQRNFIKYIILLCLTVTLLACGGGGSGVVDDGGTGGGGDGGGTGGGGGGGTGGGGGGGGAVTALEITNTSPSDYVWDAAAVGKEAYIDRTGVTISALPNDLDGFQYLRTANNDKDSIGSAHLTFSINIEATIYLAHDDKITTKPDWMSDWTDTGLEMSIADGPIFIRTYTIYSKVFSAGTVTIGGNENGSFDGSMYLVFADASGTGSDGGGGPNTGTISLSWTPPTTNENGTAITDLAGYKIRYGTAHGSYTETITLNDGSLSSYVVENLPPNTYYFVLTAFDYSGNESVFSNSAKKTIN